jgi:NADH-quinone oxidoreductase subunit G/NADP-reducing hydrogenase subunit HndD
MKIQTHSPRVIRARKTIVELLLSNHPDDCLYCVRNNNCELQTLAAQHGVAQRRFFAADKSPEVDCSSPSIQREPAKCILCGRCVRTCEEVMGVSAIDFIHRGSKTKVAPAFDMGLNESNCVSCGQCIVVCPTGAITEISHIQRVQDALADPERIVVLQHAPAVSVTLGEEFNLPVGQDVDGLLVAAARRIGFNYVFDTSFSADVTIMEEGSELVSRIKNDGPWPMFTSCSPAWVSFVETQFPQFIPNLSTCKSPQQMLGALIKSYFADRSQIDPDKIFSVSVMPCTAKKAESAREDHGREDIDAVLTTRELASLLRQRGVSLQGLSPEASDSILGERSSAGKIFGTTGGVMEAALRSVQFLLTGKAPAAMDFTALRELQGLREASVEINGQSIKVAVVSGLSAARKLLDQISRGEAFYHFVEIMSCPGGCVAGGGQPYHVQPEKIRARMKALYTVDQTATLRCSHENPQLQALYRDYLGEPMGEKSHHLLHTQYTDRSSKAQKSKPANSKD